MPRPFSEEQRRRAIRMKEMLGYQVNELEAALKLKAFDPTTLIEIAVYRIELNEKLNSKDNFSKTVSRFCCSKINCSVLFVSKRDLLRLKLTKNLFLYASVVLSSTIESPFPMRFETSVLKRI